MVARRSRSRPSSSSSSSTTPTPTADDVAALTRAVYREATALAAGLAHAMGLHPTDVNALRLLDLAGSHRPTMSELGSALGLSSPAVTGLVDRLEAHGMARRVADPDDRRRVRVELTDHAREVGEAVLAPVAERIRRAVAGLPAGHRDAVVAFLHDLLEDGELDRDLDRALGRPRTPGRP